MTSLEDIDRFTASRLNPLIGIGHPEETLEEVAFLISTMGRLLQNSDDEPRPDGLYAMFNTISAALRYEAAQITPVYSSKEGEAA